MPIDNAPFVDMPGTNLLNIPDEVQAAAKPDTKRQGLPMISLEFNASFIDEAVERGDRIQLVSDPNKFESVWEVEKHTQIE